MSREYSVCAAAQVDLPLGAATRVARACKEYKFALSVSWKRVSIIGARSYLVVKVSVPEIR